MIGNIIKNNVLELLAYSLANWKSEPTDRKIGIIKILIRLELCVSVIYVFDFLVD